MPGPLIVKIAEFAPDQPALSSGTTSNAKNVVPKTEQSYGPLNDFQPYASSALPARPQGAYGGADPEGNIAVFAGTTTDLFEMTVGTTTFTNVSKAGGYACPADENWSFTLFSGNIIAADLVDPIQIFNIATDTAFSDLSATAPKARYVTVAKNFLIAANTSDPIGGAAPWRVWWSGVGDPTNWPTPGSAAAAAVQSDFNDIIGDGGAITGIVGNLGGCDAAVIMERAVWRMNYVGPPAVFNFEPAEGVRGSLIPGSIAQLGAVVFYIGDNGFYMFDGTQSLPIGANKVDHFFFSDCIPAGYPRITAAADPVNKIVMWSYPSTDSASLIPDTLLLYNWVTNRWSYAKINLDMVFRALTFGYSLDGLDATGYNLDTLPASLDSRVWVGGQILMGAFQSNILGYLNGNNLAASVTTQELQPFSGQRALIRNTRPLVDADASGVALSVSMLSRELLSVPPSTVSTATMNTLGWCPQRASGRYIRAQIDVPANTNFTHIQGTEIDCVPIGVR